MMPDWDEIPEGSFGTRENPFLVAPEDWKKKGVPYGAWCKCSRCNCVRRSTYTFDFYAKEPGEALLCETCQKVKYYEEEEAKENKDVEERRLQEWLEQLIKKYGVGETRPGGWYSAEGDCIFYYAEDVPMYGKHINVHFTEMRALDDDRLVGLVIEGVNVSLTKLGKQLPITEEDMEWAKKQSESPNES